MREKDNGNYTSLNDFCKRLEKERINRRVLEALIKSGAMDDFDLYRSDLSSSLDDAIKTSDQSARDAAAGQEDMFGIAENNFKRIQKKEKRRNGISLLFSEKKKNLLACTYQAILLNLSKSTLTNLQMVLSKIYAKKSSIDRRESISSKTNGCGCIGTRLRY